MGSVLCAVQRHSTFSQLKGCGRLPPLLVSYEQR